MPELAVQTHRKVHALDVTDEVLALHLDGRFAFIGAPHTTAAVLLCEADPEMLEDLERVAAQLFAGFEPFRHRKNDNPNAAAHLMSGFIGAQIVRPVRDGAVELGTYQRILFLELDGPRDRTLRVESW